MNQYIIDQKFSTQQLIALIFREEEDYQKLSNEIIDLKKHFEFLREDFLASENSEDVSDVLYQNKFIKMAQKKEDVEKTRIKINQLRDSLDNRKHSIDALSMSLLQIAKQGISKVHGKPENCPKGRNIGSENLRNVIWQGRNQSIHYEEGKPNTAVQNCFSNLTVDFGSDFDLSIDSTTNRAKSIVNLLGWKSYENYEKDMESILG